MPKKPLAYVRRMDIERKNSEEMESQRIEKIKICLALCKQLESLTSDPTFFDFSFSILSSVNEREISKEYRIKFNFSDFELKN